LALAEAALLFVYCIALGIAALDSQGAKLGAPIVEIIIYLIFAAGIALIARGMLGARQGARPPYLLTQVFVLIIGWTVFSGDGPVVIAVGLGVCLIGAVALILGVLTIVKEPDRLPE
jgi:hypothetical protein